MKSVYWVLLLSFFNASVLANQIQKHADRFAEMRSIPGAAVALGSCDSIDFAVSGRIALDSETLVKTTTRFNLGSNSKSILATAIVAEF